MAHLARTTALLLAAVAVSSLLGLARAVLDEDLEQGVDVVPDVWRANFWGDLTFTAGTMLAAAAAVPLVRRARASGPDARVAWALLAVGAVLLLEWAVYAVAWSFTLQPYTSVVLDDGEGSSFWGNDWRMMYDGELLGLESAWTFTWCWGWPGLVALALGAPGVVWALEARRAGAATTVPVAGAPTRPAPTPAPPPLRPAPAPRLGTPSAPRPPSAAAPGPAVPRPPTSPPRRLEPGATRPR